MLETLPQASPDLEIIYRDEQLIAINKPSGLLVHRSWLDSHATEFAVQKLRDQIGEHVYPAHRLDRPTSGVLLFLLDKSYANNLMEQFAEQKTEKRYLAVVRGHIGEGLLDYALKKKLDKIADKHANQDQEAQEAQTYYKGLSFTELPIAVRPYPQSRYSLVELTPKTGRRHQLRRHMKHLHHPIIGDTTHGDGKHNQMFRDNFDSDRLLLHSSYLAFTHPVSGKKVEINAPLDKKFKALLATLELTLDI
ncbi:tRNA pseudouridine(65) synthase TruC [Psychromonas sp. psych-6C06]|uniref:tRNA pseudouridine(65) synthase TruC n=1 Tax=Psychromonas sp. psych-6C06 TaxID=2058089 RepID=UPI000C33815D|nr:tRNA pseudouridine(65) synthase TruC [Psychromonas sp. psych-6C06]PKF62791.1 tRNA pseudouridine(65) synthase TruC [Psychromonas sp. psych-6C06]